MRRDKPYGVIDFALTGLDYDALKNRLKKTDTGITYQPPKAGGRTKPDGTELKWEVTFPMGAERGNVPFWCQDVTPRDRRVSVAEASTTHPSGVLGIAGVIVEVREGSVNRLSLATAAITDTSSRDSDRYETDVPNAVKKLSKPSIRLQKATVDASKELSLTLVLQSPEHRPQPAIQERINDGLVSIAFE